MNFENGEKLKFFGVIFVGVLLVITFLSVQDNKTVPPEREEGLPLVKIVDGRYNSSFNENFHNVSFDVRDYMGKVEDGGYKLKEDKINGHLGLKFSGKVRFDELIVDVKIADSERSRAGLIIATSDDHKKEINSLINPCDCVVIRGVLKEGKTRIDLENITWKKRGYVKVNLKRISNQVSSPVIQEMRLR